jgi:hypothetical protein
MIGWGVLGEPPRHDPIPLRRHARRRAYRPHELIARGHEVGWYTGDQYRGKVEATGASFLGHLEARELD